MKTILHFNPEREHLDSEEATVFFSLLSQLKIKLLLLKQPERVCSLMTKSLSVCCISVTKRATERRQFCYSCPLLSLSLFYICTTEAHTSMTAPIICVKSASLTPFTLEEHYGQRKCVGYIKVVKKIVPVKEEVNFIRNVLTN